MCDNCNSNSAPLVTVHIVTGKRGRPPIKEYCADCLESEKGNYRLAGEKPVKAEGGSRNTAAEIRTIAGFDTAAIFLLSMRWENLFERATRDEMTFRCKGCRECLPRSDREKHYDEHRAKLAA